MSYVCFSALQPDVPAGSMGLDAVRTSLGVGWGGAGKERLSAPSPLSQEWLSPISHTLDSN